MDIEARVTHLVAHPERGKGTAKANIARQEGSVFIIKLDWLKECFFNFKRESELRYALDDPPSNPVQSLDDFRWMISERYKQRQLGFQGLVQQSVNGTGIEQNGQARNKQVSTSKETKNGCLLKSDGANPELPHYDCILISDDDCAGSTVPEQTLQGNKKRNTIGCTPGIRRCPVLSKSSQLPNNFATRQPDKFPEVNHLKKRRKLEQKPLKKQDIQTKVVLGKQVQVQFKPYELSDSELEDKSAMAARLDVAMHCGSKNRQARSPYHKY